MSGKSRALAAGLVWVIGGGMLIWRGWPFWITTLDRSTLTGILVLAAALIIGTAKGLFVLRKSAGRLVRRIEAHPEPRPFWEIYPVYFYPLILVMIGMGIALRHYCQDDLPGLIAGVYLGIGAALLASTTPFFAAAKRL